MSTLSLRRDTLSAYDYAYESSQCYRTLISCCLSFCPNYLRCPPQSSSMRKCNDRQPAPLVGMRLSCPCGGLFNTVVIPILHALVHVFPVDSHFKRQPIQRQVGDTYSVSTTETRARTAAPGATRMTRPSRMDSLQEIGSGVWRQGSICTCLKRRGLVVRNYVTCYNIFPRTSSEE